MMFGFFYNGDVGLGLGIVYFCFVIKILMGCFMIGGF